MSIRARYIFGPNCNLKDKYLKDLEEMDSRFFPGCEYPKREGNHWWGIFDRGIMIGFCGLDTSRFKKKAFLCRAALEESYRGLKLHKRMTKIREKFAKQLKIYSVVTYASYSNITSSNSLIKSGYLIYKPRIPYGTSNAIYLLKNLKNGKKKKTRIKKSYCQSTL
jgi:hypothetical protein